MNGIQFFEVLVADLERSGIEFYFEIIHFGGETLIEYNYNVDRNLFEKFKNDQFRSKFIFKEMGSNLEELEYKGKLYDLLLTWIGNITIVKQLFYRIKIFCNENKYNIYTYVNKQVCRDNFYEEILLEKAFDSSAIIFESENRIVSISVNWLC
ncbi:hypothetical protein [Clostridium massiliamazoniense]|uniref:hypothetical protein n=1 Tax=Clostridium massiliamazoniense TaxID=1347366 RepID=UPI0006D80A10|nr:hypothetical protein [Clostridium massiliamazoniense]